MKKSIAISVSLLGAVGLYWVVQAGNLEPSDPPAPTMKSLDLIPPPWSQRLDSTNGSTDALILGCNSSRFKCVMSTGSPVPLPKAVLDLETGLVWERSPQSGDDIWINAHFECRHRTTGGRKGWRLPASVELASLVDPSQGTPALPPGHPFTNVTESAYWSSTTDPSNTERALYLSVAGPLVADPKTYDFGIWCVRGGTPNFFTSQPNLPSP